MIADLYTKPRRVPGRLAPMLAGSGLILLALPVFAVAGWPLQGWALAAVLWVAAQALGYLLTRLPMDEGNLAAAGVRGIGMGFRAFIVGIPLVAVTVADSAPKEGELSVRRTCETSVALAVVALSSNPRSAALNPMVRARLSGMQRTSRSRTAGSTDTHTGLVMGSDCGARGR